MMEVRARILVVLANYGTKNDAFLHRVMAEYRSFSCEVDIIVLTNSKKDLENASEVIVHNPSGHPWTFPFAHKAILAERVDQYDLFIYSEDDTLITEDNIAAFVATTEVLKANEIAGFVRVEMAANGRTSVCTINGHFHWEPASVVKRGEQTFAYFTNEHAASYVLTRDQLRRAIQSGGYLVAPHEEKYDLLVTAATDPYTQCGFRKLICISELQRFCIAHLPNKYLGEFGVDLSEVEQQIGALGEIGEGTRLPTVLAQTESRLRHQLWSKRFYEPSREEVLAIIQTSARTVLSFGCGSGILEGELKRRGIEVTAVPLDSVIGANVEARGVEVVYGNGSSVFSALSGRKFDCIVALDILHLDPDPIALLAKVVELVGVNGSVVASVPNIVRLRVLWRYLSGDPSVEGLTDYDRSGIHAVSYWAMKRWFELAGLRITSAAAMSSSKKTWVQTASRLVPSGFADEFIFQAVRSETTAPIPSTRNGN